VVEFGFYSFLGKKAAEQIGIKSALTNKSVVKTRRGSAGVQP